MRSNHTNRGRSLYRLPAAPRGPQPPMGPPPRPRVPAGLEDAILILLLHAGHSAVRGIEQALEPMGLMLPHVMLLTALKADGPQSQTALCKPTHIDRTTMVAFVDYLEEKGLVERVRDPRDRRAYQVSLTAAGDEAVDQIRSAHETAEASLLEPLSAEEREALRSLLRRLAAPDPSEEEPPEAT